MPFYKYFCEKCHDHFEKLVSKAMNPSSIEKCPKCNEDSELVNHAFREDIKK